MFLIFLYVPTVLLIIFSFNDSTVAAFPLAGLTLKWYREAFTDHADPHGAAEQPQGGERLRRDRDPASA